MKLEDFWERHAFKLIAICIIVLVALIAGIARAAGQSANVSWTHPTQYTDGSALVPAEIKETVVSWRRPGNTLVVGSVRVAAPATSTVVTGLACGSFSFTAVTVVRTNDVQSAEGGPVLYATGVQCAPNPPTGLKAE